MSRVSRCTPPLLMMGAVLGGLEAHWFLHQGAGLWEVISMGVILGGTMRASFTAIVFVLERTRDINLMFSVVMDRMATTDLTALPVVDRNDRGRLLGTITLHDMLKAHARHLEEEQRRERVLPLNMIMPPFMRAIATRREASSGVRR